MDFQKVRLSRALIGDVIIMRYMPLYQQKGIVATKITEILDNRLTYENLPMGVHGNFDQNTRRDFRAEGLRIDEVLVILPPNFQSPISDDYVYTVGGVLVPRSRKPLLPYLSRNVNYQRSLEGLKNPERMQTESELKTILNE